MCSSKQWNADTFQIVVVLLIAKGKGQRANKKQLSTNLQKLDIYNDNNFVPKICYYVKISFSEFGDNYLFVELTNSKT